MDGHPNTNYVCNAKCQVDTTLNEPLMPPGENGKQTEQSMNTDS